MNSIGLQGCKLNMSFCHQIAVYQDNKSVLQPIMGLERSVNDLSRITELDVFFIKKFPFLANCLRSREEHATHKFFNFKSGCPYFVKSGCPYFVGL